MVDIPALQREIAGRTEAGEATDEAVLEIIGSCPSATLSEIGLIVGRSKSTVWASLRRLENSGHVSQALCEICGGHIWQRRTPHKLTPRPGHTNPGM